MYVWRQCMRSLALLGLCGGLFATVHAQQPAAAQGPKIVLPLERTAYFIGERVPMAVSGLPVDANLLLEAVNAEGRVCLYQGKPTALWLDTARLAAGDYRLDVNGAPALERLTLASPLRKSAGSMQDEALPGDGLKPDQFVRILKESGLTAAVAMGVADAGRFGQLDTMARAGAMLFVNPETRPCSFLPVGNDPLEMDGMSQRMLLTAQANSRYPNFGGFCFGWDAAGHAPANKLMLLTYWSWGDKTQALRNYIARERAYKLAEFTRRTDLEPVTDAEYIAYLLSIKRPELAPAIDLPTKRWLEEIAKYSKPMQDAERLAFEKRLDAWSSYLMSLYNESYTTYMKQLRALDPTMRHTSSVQVDHAPVLQGQYFPSAYEPLDFAYQTTWNDQVGGPDYLDQSLFVTGMLNMHSNGKPIWISNAMGSAHALTELPGKMVRTTAQGLPYGGSGIGFALEGFSNILGGMNRATNWTEIQGKAGEADVRTGREFLDRFASLAVEGRGDYGVGILFSKTQFGRQYITMGFGTPSYKAMVALTRLGYTPRFVTEEDIIAGRTRDIKALVVIGQTVPLPENVAAGLAAFSLGGGRVLVDGASTVTVPGALALGLSFPFTVPGKPHSWGAPNMVAGDNDTLMYDRWHPELARGFSQALGDTGHAVLTAEKGVESDVSLSQIDGGRDAKYVIAVNDSHIRNQADWHQVTERLLPTKGLAPTAVIYDCTDERALGTASPITCEMTKTTARVYAVLPRPVASHVVAATQTVTAGEAVTVQVSFLDAAKQRLSAVLPFHLAVLRPDGQVYQDFYRATKRDGQFTMTVTIPANLPAGTWSVAVRSQLNGVVATLPITVQPAVVAPAVVMNDAVVVRDRVLLESTLQKGARLTLPIFDTPQSQALLPVAERVKAVLAKRGVEVDIWQKPTIGNYWLAYDLTPEQQAENDAVEHGAIIGKLKRITVNGNDWFSGQSGYRCGRPLLLLDVAGQPGDNPLAEALVSQGNQHLANIGILWPQVTADFPGRGRAVVQGVKWAFGPELTTLVIQASDLDGLRVGADALAKLPTTDVMASVRTTRDTLFRQYHIGGTPVVKTGAKVTANGLKVANAPQPFALTFPTEQPLPAAQVTVPQRPEKTYTAVPAKLEPNKYVIQLQEDGKYIESATAGFLVPDLRFSDAVMLYIDVPQAGPTRITADGLFRYNDRQPCWQAQWEDLIALREKLVPKERRPVQFAVQVDGKPAGMLTAVITAEREVPLELRSSSAGMKPKTQVEEVVLQVSGEINLPAGKHQLLLIHQNIVDGQLKAVYVGTDAPAPAAK